MEFITPAVISTADGSPTLVDPASGDTYHSVNGAVQESLHVFVENGLRACEKNRIAVLEAGFGTGLNAWLTAHEAARMGRYVIYTTVELNPVAPECLTPEQGFPADDLFTSLHSAQWSIDTVLSHNFILHKVHGDLAEWTIDVKFDVVYFDMFAPDTNPGLWTEEIFARLARSMSPGGVLVTYSAKGDVKRALRAAGFEVYRLPGAPGKRHMLRAVREDGQGVQNK